MMTSCFPFAQYESARTLGKGKGSLGVTGMGYILYDRSSGLTNSNDVIPLGSLEISGGYGLTDRSDVRLMVNSFGFVYLDYKQMLIGDRQSYFALSSGFGVDGNPVLPLTQNADPFVKMHLPLYMSWHKSNKYFFINPKVSYQIVFEGKKTIGTPFAGVGIGGGFFNGDFEIFGGTGPILPFTPTLENKNFALFWQTGIGARYYIR